MVGRRELPRESDFRDHTPIRTESADRRSDLTDPDDDTSVPNPVQAAAGFLEFPNARVSVFLIVAKLSSFFLACQ